MWCSDILHFGPQDNFPMRNFMDNCHVLNVMFINTEYFTFTLLHFHFSAFLFYLFVTHFIFGRKPLRWNVRFLRHVIPKGVRLCVRTDWTLCLFFCFQALMGLLKPSADRSPATPTTVSGSFARITTAVAPSTGRGT